MKIDLAVLKALERERNMPFDTVIGALETALLAAYRQLPDAAQEARVVVDRATGELSVLVAVRDDDGALLREIDEVPADFGRIATTTAKQVMASRLRAASDDAMHEQYANRVGDIVTGTIAQHAAKFRTTGALLVDLGNTEAILPAVEQVPTETYTHGQRLRCVVVRVERTQRGTSVTLSRTHPDLVRGLFKLEVPEVADGTVEIVALAREAGFRTKMAVRSLRPGVKAKSACIGQRGSRVAAVVEELAGEKIDIVDWLDDPAAFVAEALQPSRVLSVEVVDLVARSARVVVPDYQLSLAIGREGQNARLAARLTGWRIDITSDAAAAATAETVPHADGAAAPPR
ncbi:MAG TPA: transcription termination factor NusA [Frankiaceae bacterium]|jgi:N utilization substance protein A